MSSAASWNTGIMTDTDATRVLTFYEKHYDPAKVLKHPDFRVLQANEKPDKKANIACAYNPNHDIHLINKPMPEPAAKEVILHVRATGICG